jgi:hypothetical protein
MIRTVFKLGLILVVGILIYNYFLGTPEEKASSEKIFSEVKDLGVAAWGLLKSEKQKFDEGKYDEALDKVGNLFSNLREKASQLNDRDLSDRIDNLEQQRKDIQEKVDRASDSLSEEEKAELKEQFRSLMDQTEGVMEDLEKK